MERVKVRLTVSLPVEVAEKLENIPWGLKGRVVSYILEEALTKNSIEELAALVLKAGSSKSPPAESPPADTDSYKTEGKQRQEKTETEDKTDKEGESGITKEIEETFGDFTLD